MVLSTTVQTCTLKKPVENALFPACAETPGLRAMLCTVSMLLHNGSAAVLLRVQQMLDFCAHKSVPHEAQSPSGQCMPTTLKHAPCRPAACLNLTVLVVLHPGGRKMLGSGPCSKRENQANLPGVSVTRPGGPYSYEVRSFRGWDKRILAHAAIPGTAAAASMK